MKEQYIKQVEKELSLPRKMKKEVVRDLNEVFASAMEHGETEQQIIQRLGTPKEFADSTAEQFGIDNTKSKKRNGIISTLAALVIAAAAFSVYAVTPVSYTHLTVGTQIREKRGRKGTTFLRSSQEMTWTNMQAALT